MNVLVVGGAGYIGSHCVRQLAAAGHRPVVLDNLVYGHRGAVARPVPFYELGLGDGEAVRNILEKEEIGLVMHFAAFCYVGESVTDPLKYYLNNVGATLQLFKSMLGAGVKQFVFSSTCATYGVPGRLPITEDSHFNPCSHYAVSKVAQETLGLMYYQAFGWRVFVTRGFNQVGPGQSPDFAVPSFARQVALIEGGFCEPVLRVGNLEAKRDFTDARDTVRAYRMVMERGTAGAAYNVCSGTARPVSEILELLLSLSASVIRVERDPERQRPTDIPVLVGDNTRLREETGWEPRISLKETLRDTLNYWRERVDAEQSAS